MTGLACTSCGAQVEVVYGAWSYYLLWWTSQIGWQLASILIVVMAFLRSWFWLAMVAGISIGFELLRSFVLRRGAEVRWINAQSMGRRAAGQWVPD